MFNGAKHDVIHRLKHAGQLECVATSWKVKCSKISQQWTPDFHTQRNSTELV